MRRELAPLLLGTLVALGGACGGATKPGEPVTSAPRAARHWRVYDGDLAILEVSDRPGPITSTAMMPPDATPTAHPFLSASALDAGHEDQLRTLLEAAQDLDGFLRALESAGYRVVAE